MQQQTFTVEDIHRRNQGTVVVVGIQSTEGKVWPASARIASVLRDASARELGRFLGQIANVDGKGYVVSFTATIAIEAPIDPASAAPALDVTTLTVAAPIAKEYRAVSREVARDSISLDGLGLNIARTS